MSGRLGRLLLLGLAGALLLYGLRWAAVGSGVGAGFAAHVTCSLAFVSGLPPERAFEEYVRHEIWPLGPALGLEVGEGQMVARVLGVERARAVHRPGLGCLQVFDGVPFDAGAAPPRPPARDPRRPWPLGDAAPRAPVAPALEAALDRAFTEPEPGGPLRRLTQAVVIVRSGELVAERYAPGIDAGSRLMSMSMAKSVLATLYGVAEAQGRVDRRAPAPVPEWQGDARRAITIDQLLRMSSGLAFDERYGATNDASVMLFARPDAAAYAAAQALDAAPDTVWSYSSGTSNVLARTLAGLVGNEGLRAWVRRELFARIGAHSAVVEEDAAGTLVFSSFVYMSARDWARLGELHRNDGVWLGERVLPEGWVGYVTTPTPASHGEYGAHWWLNRGSAEDPSVPNWPDLPPDTYAAWGHSGQYVMVVPSEQLVVVRLGLTTPDGGDDGAARLAADVIAHYRNLRSAQ